MHASLPNKNLQGNYFFRFFPTGAFFFIDAGDFTCLAGKREILCPSLRLPLNEGEMEALQKLKEKKCDFQAQFVQLSGFCQRFTENPFFISNEILTTIMSIPPTFPLFFYDKILAIIMSVPPTFPVMMNLPKLL